MRDTEFATVLRDVLIARVQSQGVSVTVKQAQQPTQQGIVDGPGVYFQKLFDYRYGQMQRSDSYDEIADEFVHTESVQLISTYQVNAIRPLNPGDPSALTSADLLRVTAMALQSDVVMAQLRAQGIGVLRVQNLRTIYENNDRGQNQQTPVFDVEFTHRETTTDRVKRVETYDINVQRV